MLGAALCLLWAAQGATPARAQEVPDLDRSRYSPASFYSYAEPGDVKILVNVWGTVRDPGLYEVPHDTRMSTLLSVAGGPAVVARGRDERREVVVRLSRLNGTRREDVYRTTMRDDIFASEQDPLLQEADVLIVETTTRRRFSWRDAFPIISTAASVGIAIAYFTD